MQVSRTNTSETEIKLVITATGAELLTLKQHVLGHFRSRVKVAGFREGKVPLEMVEKNVDQAQFQTEFLEEAVQNLYVQAIDNEKIRPVDRPEVQLKKFVPFTALEFEVDIPVVGEVKLPDYKKMKKAKEAVEITDKDVDDVIAALQKRLAEKKDVERAAKTGDEVWIDFKGVDAKGEAVNGADGKDYPIILGSNTFIPGFEENVEGMSAGEEKTFTLTFPKDYGVKTLASKDVTFTVTVTKVQELTEPKLDDEFAAKAGPFKTVKELKADIRKQVESERQYEADRNHEAELIKQLTQKTKVSVPDVLIQEQIERSVRELKQNVAYRGLTWQEYLEAEGKSEEDYLKDVVRPQAEERLRASLVLAEIAEKEGLVVTPEELEIRMQLLKGQYQDPGMQAELEKPETRRDIAARMLTEKAIAKITEYASA
jgi:trigger factor